MAPRLVGPSGLILPDASGALRRRTPSKLDLLHAAFRTDFVSFVHKCFQTLSPGARFCSNWHIQALAYHLELVRAGKIKRLIINMPPRSLKSVVSSVAFPAFVLGHEPTRRIICV